MRRVAAAVVLGLSMLTYGACVGEDGVAGSESPPVTDAGAIDGDALSPSPPADAGSDVSMDATDAGSCWERPFGTPTLVSALSSVDVELNVRLSLDERTVYFSSARDGGVGGFDSWTAKRPTLEDAWEVPTNLGSLNTSLGEIHPAVSPNNLTLFFARDVVRDGGGGTHANLFMVTRPSAFPTPPFTDFPAVEVTSLNTTANDSFPYATSTGLYFGSDRAGETRIYYAPRTGTSFGAASDVPGLHETGSISNCPVASADGLHLYFASNRTGTQGALDVYVASRATPAAAFSAPINVSELNTSANERPGFISADGCRMYFTSDRPGGVGGLDIWLATRAP